MQKTIDRYELKILDMQKQVDTLSQTNEVQKEENERLNNELTDLTDIHQVEMSSMKNDLKKLEDKLIYSSMNIGQKWLRNSKNSIQEYVLSMIRERKKNAKIHF